MADETKLTAATRLEKLLDNIAGGENEVTPATRLEKFLSYIADAMEGGGGSGGGGEIPNYVIKTVPEEDRPEGFTAAQYIDADPAVVVNSFFTLTDESSGAVYTPVSYGTYLGSDVAYVVIGLTDYIEDVGGLLTYRNFETGIETEEFPYGNYLVYVEESGGGSS